MRLLIAHDGGPTGERAIAAVAPWAMRSAAEIHVLRVLKPGTIHDTVRPGAIHVLTPGSTPTGTLLYAEEPPAVLAEDRSQALDAVRATAAEEIVALAEGHIGAYPITTHVVVGRDAPAEIVALATAIGAALIAVGTHGRTGVSHAVLGSIAEAVVRESPVPVVVVGPSCG